MQPLSDTELEALLEDLESDRVERKESWAGSAPDRGREAVLAADLFSLQGLRNLGPTLRRWRDDWEKRVANWTLPSFPLPKGAMRPVGYIVQQHMERLSRPAYAYEKWARRIPGVYATSVLGETGGPESFDSDPNCLARLKHYRSLVPMAQKARKPIFRLTTADGALGAHSYAVSEARQHFEYLANIILERIGCPKPLA